MAGTPLTVTVTVTAPDPGGAESMVIIPPVAVLTVAGFPAPKSTTSFATVVEKPVPWMTTLFPPAGRPEAGTMLVRVGVRPPRPSPR